MRMILLFLALRQPAHAAQLAPERAPAPLAALPLGAPGLSPAMTSLPPPFSWPTMTEAPGAVMPIAEALPATEAAATSKAATSLSSLASPLASNESSPNANPAAVLRLAYDGQSAGPSDDGVPVLPDTPGRDERLAAPSSESRGGGAVPPPPHRNNPLKRAAALVPSVFVLATLFTGAEAVCFAARGWVLETTGLILFAGILKDLSGRSARLLKTRGLSRTKADALADAAACGVAPAAMIYQAALHGLGLMGATAALIFGAVSAYRAFKGPDGGGLPIYAAAGTMAALALASGALPVAAASWVAAVGTILTVAAMLSRIPFPTYRKVTVALALLAGATAAEFLAPLSHATLCSLIPLAGFSVYLGMGLLRALRRR